MYPLIVEQKTKCMEYLFSVDSPPKSNVENTKCWVVTMSKGPKEVTTKWDEDQGETV